MQVFYYIKFFNFIFKRWPRKRSESHEGENPHAEIIMLPSNDLLECFPVLSGDESAGGDLEELEVVVLGEEVEEDVARDGVALVYCEGDQLLQGVGGGELGPDHVIQAVHQLETEGLEAGGGEQQLPEDVGHDAAAVLVLQDHILQLGELVLGDNFGD